MRVALKTMVIIWAAIAIASFCGIIYLAPFYAIDGAFTQALHGRPDSILQYWFHWLEVFLYIGLAMTFWLRRTYRNQYGRFWRGKGVSSTSAR